MIQDMPKSLDSVIMSFPSLPEMVQTNNTTSDLSKELES